MMDCMAKLDMMNMTTKKVSKVEELEMPFPMSKETTRFDQQVQIYRQSLYKT